MEFEIVTKPSFSVIGKEGSTDDGEGFVRRLWNDANSHFAEISRLAKRRGGFLAGAWGLMSDFSRNFLPWEDGFSKGLYLAGIECLDDAVAPQGWKKWTMPAFKYLKIPCEGAGTFQKGLALLKENGFSLAGAAQDFTDLTKKTDFILFPVEKV